MFDELFCEWEPFSAELAGSLGLYFFLFESFKLLPIDARRTCSELSAAWSWGEKFLPFVYKRCELLRLSEVRRF